MTLEHHEQLPELSYVPMFEQPAELWMQIWIHHLQVPWALPDLVSVLSKLFLPDHLQLGSSSSIVVLLELRCQLGALAVTALAARPVSQSTVCNATAEAVLWYTNMSDNMAVKGVTVGLSAHRSWCKCVQGSMQRNAMLEALSWYVSMMPWEGHCGFLPGWSRST